MNDFPRWKHFLVAAVALLGILYAIPSLYQKQPAVQVLANKSGVVDEAVKERALQALQTRKITFSMKSPS
jgi:preprotein translocase subunit SecD